MSSNDKIRIASIFHSVSAISSTLSPVRASRDTGYVWQFVPVAIPRCFRNMAFLNPTGIDHIATSAFSIFSRETLTGLKLVVVVHPTFPVRAAQEILLIVYSHYSDFVLKDPFYATDMPIRCSLFDKAVRQVLQVGS